MVSYGGAKGCGKSLFWEILIKYTFGIAVHTVYIDKEERDLFGDLTRPSCATLLSTSTSSETRS
jgi:hypothetical protein